MKFGNGIAAHRGNMGAFPENTMPAFESAVQLGCSWIELDIQLTKDNCLVVTHDLSSLRVTGVEKMICNSNYSELKELNFGNYLHPNSHYTLPLLSEVFELVKNTNTKISIQPKNYGLVKLAYHLAKQMNMQDSIGFNDTNCEFLIEAKLINSHLPVFWDRPPHTDFDTDVFVAQQYGFDTLMYEWQGITESKIQTIQGLGIRFGACVVNEQEMMIKYLNMGVEHFYTDYPELLLKLK